MKDQYVGDVNDYLKYALLRELRGDDLQLLVVWMRTGADGRGDGRRIAYLNNPEQFRFVDPDLYDLLCRLMRGGERRLASIENSAVLPGARFASRLVPRSLSDREDFLRMAIGDMPARSLVFFDPDNGLEVASAPRGSALASKYLFWDEVALAYQYGHSLIVYQHFPRRPRLPFLDVVADELVNRCGCGAVRAITTPHVAFLVLPQNVDEPELTRRLRRFAARSDRVGARFHALRD